MGILPSSENWGLYQNNYPQLVCILALYATKEAIRLGGGWGGGGGGKVEKINLAKHTIDLLLLLASMRLDMSRIQSYINSMCNIMILIIRISI